MRAGRVLFVGLLALACVAADRARAEGPTAEDERFFAELQAVGRDDAAWVCGRIGYPLVIRTARAALRIAGTAACLERYAAIFPPGLKAIVAAQAPAALFKNADGLMVGDGELWFAPTLRDADDENSVEYLIIAVNPPR
jgi:hypothetical protein